jgi:hypothetical protein
MAAPVETRLRDWQHLVELDGETQNRLASDPDFFFRGQARADWHLVPSILRVAEANKLDAVRSRWLEDQLLAEFRTAAHLYLPPTTLPGNEADVVAWWGLMQHYGAPTRLLDWTRSLYVATYFAVEREPDYDAAIWIIHPETIRASHRSDDAKWPASHEDLAMLLREDAEPIVYTIADKYQTDRMSAQQTVFSVSAQILSRHDVLIGKAYPQQDRRYRKITIPKELKLEFLRRLRQVNITARALFPGIDGIGRSVSELSQIDSAAVRYLKKGDADGPTR